MPVSPSRPFVQHRLRQHEYAVVWCRQRERLPGCRFRSLNTAEFFANSPGKFDAAPPRKKAPLFKACAARARRVRSIRFNLQKMDTWSTTCRQCSRNAKTKLPFANRAPALSPALLPAEVGAIYRSWLPHPPPDCSACSPPPTLAAGALARSARAVARCASFIYSSAALSGVRTRTAGAVRSAQDERSSCVRRD